MRRRVRFFYAVILIAGLVMSAYFLAQRFGNTIALIAMRNVDTYSGEILAFKQEDARAGFRADSILFVGSSSFRLWDDMAARFAPRPVINRGFGGAQLRHVVHHYDDLIAVYKPRVLVLYVGGNDIAASVKPTVILQDFDRLMAMVRNDFPDLPVLVVSLKPAPARLDNIPMQMIVNGGLKNRAADDDHLHYVDVATPMLKALKQQDQAAALFLPDMLHMTAKGYDIWATEISWHLDRILGRVVLDGLDLG